MAMPTYKIIHNPKLEPAWGTFFKTIAESWSIEMRDHLGGRWNIHTYTSLDDAKHAITTLNSAA